MLSEILSHFGGKVFTKEREAFSSLRAWLSTGTGSLGNLFPGTRSRHQTCQNSRSIWNALRHLVCFLDGLVWSREFDFMILVSPSNLGCSLYSSHARGNVLIHKAGHCFSRAQKAATSQLLLHAMGAFTQNSARIRH